MDLVLFSGYARMPSNTTAQKLYEELALVFVVDMNTGVVQKVECTLATALAKEFVTDLFVGFDMNRGADAMADLISYKYQGHMKKALANAAKMIWTNYEEMRRQMK